jgi:hypothetical protein
MNQAPPESPFEQPPAAGEPSLAGPFIPAGMPPGTEYAASGETAPEGVTYFRIVAVIHGLMSGFVALFGLVMMIAPLAVPSSSRGGADVATWAVGFFYTGVGAALFVPTAVALFGGRRPWVHTLGTVVIGLGMLNMCCIPLLVPVLIVWMKPETRRWYGA